MAKKIRTKRVAFYLSYGLVEDLEREAHERNINESALVREALRLYFMGKGNPNETAKVKDTDLDQLLEDCTDFFGRFITTPTDPDFDEEEGFFYECEERGINLGDLTTAQFERVAERLDTGYEGFLFKPDIDDFLGWVEECGATKDQLERLRKVLVGDEEPEPEPTEEATEETEEE